MAFRDDASQRRTESSFFRIGAALSFVGQLALLVVMSPLACGGEPYDPDACSAVRPDYELAVVVHSGQPVSVAIRTVGDCTSVKVVSSGIPGEQVWLGTMTGGPTSQCQITVAVGFGQYCERSVAIDLDSLCGAPFGAELDVWVTQGGAAMCCEDLFHPKAPFCKRA